MSDLPDWVQAASNLGTVLTNSTLPATGQGQYDASNNTSVVIALSTQSPDKQITVRVDWYTDATLSALVAEQYVTAPAVVGQVGILTVESPIYGATLVVTNLNANPLTITVIGSSRAVPNFRYILDQRPGQLFEYQGAIVSGTPVTLNAVDGKGALFPNNGQIYLYSGTTVAGNIVATYVDANGAVQNLNVSIFSAAAQGQGFVALPQAMIQFQFSPTASSASAQIFIYAVKASL